MSISDRSVVQTSRRCKDAEQKAEHTSGPRSMQKSGKHQTPQKIPKNHFKTLSDTILKSEIRRDEKNMEIFTWHTRIFTWKILGTLRKKPR